MLRKGSIPYWAFSADAFSRFPPTLSFSSLSASTPPHLFVPYTFIPPPSLSLLCAPWSFIDLDIMITTYAVHTRSILLLYTLLYSLCFVYTSFLLRAPIMKPDVTCFIIIIIIRKRFSLSLTSSRSLLLMEHFLLACYRFRIDNTDHIIDVNKNNAAFEYDQVNIICPVYLPGRYDDEAEKYIIYNVS